MVRTIWKGAISFGLVHIPVSLSAAVSSERIDFDWLDQRTMDPVGYKRVNKTTGKEVDKENIVQAVLYEKGRYVVISEDEIRQARPESTQTIEIFSFVAEEEIPLQHFDTPYYLSPEGRGGKVYALLRETLASTGKVALAKVVLRTQQYLAMLRPLEQALVMIKLRWPEEVRSLDSLELDGSVIAAKPEKRELQMAKRLVDEMSGPWSPQDYRNDFKQTIMDLVEEKANKGKVTVVDSSQQDAVSQKGADIIDLTELLKRSLNGKPGAPKKVAPAKKTAAAKKSPPTAQRAPRKAA